MSSSAETPAPAPANTLHKPLIADRRARLAEASRIISNYTGWSAASGLIPVPVLDVAAVAAVQVKMIIELGKLYGQTLSENAVTSVVAVVLGVLLPTGAANLATRFLWSSVPFVGFLSSVASLSAFSSLASYVIGKVFVRYFESGGTFQALTRERLQRELESEMATQQAA